MTGRSRFGKMSTDIRSYASTEQSTRPTTITTIVIGRRRARLISHIDWLFHSLEKWFQIALEPGGDQQRAPDVETRYGILDLGLGQKSLCVGDVGHGCQPVFVSLAGQPLSFLRRLELIRGFPGDAQRP